MNSVTLTGNATKDLELTFSPQGTAFAKGTIAVQRNFKNQQGEYETDFINFKCIGKMSETMANYINKGDKFGIVGQLHINKWEKDGKTSYFTEVIVNSFDFPYKSKNDSSQGNTSGNQNKGKESQQKPSEDPFDNDEAYISDQDLPF